MDKSTDYKYYSFDADNSILYHEVKKENFSDKASFIISLSYFVTLIEKFEPRRIIVKVYKKPGYFELELNNFMQSTLFPALINNNVKKVAFYVSDHQYIMKLKEHEIDKPVMVRFFADLEMAKEWALE